MTFDGSEWTLRSSLSSYRSVWFSYTILPFLRLIQPSSTTRTHLIPVGAWGNIESGALLSKRLFNFFKLKIKTVIKND